MSEKYNNVQKNICNILEERFTIYNFLAFHIVQIWSSNMGVKLAPL